uniref:Myb/SANT-like domain-containing protein n=1 Tax=Nelumbo nucifera TaxID=4432 RepID=A0A822XDJ6_NELNU|nr:TPA_asm: hypothetical protein HUJ06_019720 [Nelumbo nucifera]
MWRFFFVSLIALKYFLLDLQVGILHWEAVFEDAYYHESRILTSHQEKMATELDSEELKLGLDCAQWSDAEEETFINLIVDQVRANNSPTSSFNAEGWKYIRQKFNEKHDRSYVHAQFKNKYNVLRQRRKRYLTLLNYTGVIVDPLTKNPTSNEEV